VCHVTQYMEGTGKGHDAESLSNQQQWQQQAAWESAYEAALALGSFRCCMHYLNQIKAVPRMMKVRYERMSVCIAAGTGAWGLAASNVCSSRSKSSENTRHTAHTLVMAVQQVTLAWCSEKHDCLDWHNRGQSMASGCFEGAYRRLGAVMCRMEPECM